MTRWVATPDRRPTRGAAVAPTTAAATLVVALVAAAGAAPSAPQSSPHAGEQTGSDTPTAEPPRQLVAAVHVHSQASSGSQSIAQLAGMARAAGVDALVLAENLGYEFRYAPRWLRPFVEARVAGPTLERYGIDRYLAEIEQARAAAPDVTIVAGVEAPPFYYWTGSLLHGDLTLHDLQRNVLVLPPTGDPAAAAQLLAGLPAVGNRLLRGYHAASLARLLPGLLLLLASAYGVRRRRPRAARSRPRLALAGGLVGGALLWANFPFTVSPMQPYEATGSRPAAQQLFEYVRAGGGLAFWSMPEAVDDRRRAVGPVSVHLLTPPYPEALGETSGYSGFGGVYADTVTIWEAGRAWDEALLSYQSGDRRAPPWLLGESAYHYPGHAGKQLDDVLTVLLTTDRTPAGVLAALAAGGMYALRREPGGADLRLGEMALIAADEEEEGGPTPARLGETLTLRDTGAARFDVVLQLDDLAAAGTGVVVEVVRNGVTWRRFDTTTPLRERWQETLAAGEQAAYYRVIARASRPAYLVSNPVFVRRAGATGTPR